MLTDLLKEEFERAVRERGTACAAAGLVRRLAVKDDYLEAEVEGSETYDVTIDSDRRPGRWDLLALCTCPYAETAPCKHMWATLVKARDKINAKWGPAPESVRLFLDEEEFVEAGDEVYEDEDLYGGSGAPIPFLVGKQGQGAYLLPPGPRRSAPAGPAKPPPKPKRPAWQRMFDHAPRDYRAAERTKPRAPIGPLRYVLDVERSRLNGVLTLALTQGATGERVGKRTTINTSAVALLTDAQDRAICAMLVGAARPGRESYYSSMGRSDAPSSLWQLDHDLSPLMIPMLFGTGRLFWSPREDLPARPLRWDDRPWELSLVIEPAHTSTRKRASYLLHAGLLREGEQRRFGDFALICEGHPGLALREDSLAPLHSDTFPGCLAWLERQQEVEVGPEDVFPLIGELQKRGMRIPLRWPPEWPLRERTDLAPRPRLTLSAPGARNSSGATLEARLSFRYGDDVIAESDGGVYLESPPTEREPTRMLIRRQADAEQGAAARLRDLGVRPDPYSPGRATFPAKKLTKLVAPLIGEGWEVRGEGGLFRPPGKISIRVASGIDWFDVEGEAEFGDQSAPIAALLAALKKGERFVTLGDGSQGMLPEDWLERHAGWMRLGEASGDGVRFARSQLGLIDALLAALPEATCDAQVAEARRRLAAFEGVAPRGEPAGFVGELRPYQRLGLGWLHFLDEFGFGGCLADDMGLGKTVQVLAFLAERATPEAREGAGPWLVVAPRSLVFNWGREAARFAPGLRVADCTGPDRDLGAAAAGADLVLTTYGTMRRDIERLREVEFAGVVLDEAQAIKNADSQSAKGARLLRARRRLALTGTPVENSLDDLWSIFEFLNPGMLGSAGAFALAARAAADGRENPDLTLLRRALRPFILRRTKQLVAPELPARTEQTIPCELSGRQRTIYEDLRKLYRAQLLGRIDREGLNKSRMHVLEALLRLRQAACHPMLIEPKATRAESAKFTALLGMLEEIGAEGNKALVFSQFTSLLDLVEPALACRKVTFERLDGQTPAAERTRRVDRFQTDPGCSVFLVSLKAGGVGLNLTAAQYVFLLDPWWNPAAEAQAIDRTHRIGQERRVSAYRLIAKDTIEERILQLQASKRGLAEAILTEQKGGLTALTREDLEWLLG